MFTGKIEDLRNEKIRILTETDTKVNGLSIKEDGVYHNGIFSENWSDAQGLLISSQLCVAMQPSLKAIFIDKGESFDKKKLEALSRWAVDNGIQAFITIVDEYKGTIEDGVFYIIEGEIITQNNQ